MSLRIFSLFFFLPKGFTVTNTSGTYNLTNALANNLNYDHISSTNTSDRYIYRVQQRTSQLTNPNLTLSQLTFSIWSGMMFS